MSSLPRAVPVTASSDNPRAARAADPEDVPGGRWQRVLPAVVLLGISVLVLWRTGPGKVPGPEGFEATARIWPHQVLPPEAAYVLRQALGQALYRALGWSGTGHYLALHIAALVVSGALLAVWLVRQLGLQRGTIASCLLVLSPVTAVLLEWIGLYDAFSVLVWVALVLVLRRSWWLQLVVGVLGGLQNFEQFLVSVVLLALLPELGRRFGLRARVVPLVVGSLAGKVALELYLSREGASSGSRAAFLENPELLHFVLTTFAYLAPIIIYTVLGPLWLPVVQALPGRWAAAGRLLRLRALAAAGIVLLMGVLAADHTRVMTLITFPALVILCMHLAATSTDVRSWIRQPATWLLILVPPFVIVSGGSPLPLGLDLATWFSS